MAHRSKLLLSRESAGSSSEIQTGTHEPAFCSHGWDGIQEQLSAIEQRLDARDRDMDVVRKWVGSLEARVGASVVRESAEKGMEASDLASVPQPPEGGEENSGCAVTSSCGTQDVDRDELKLDVLSRKVEELFLDLTGDVNSRLAAIVNCLHLEVENNVADMVLRIDQRLLAATSQIDAFLCKSDMELVGSAQRAAQLLDFSEPSQARVASDLFQKEEESESLARKHPSKDSFIDALRNQRSSFVGLGPVGCLTRESIDGRMFNNSPSAVNGITSRGASLSVAVTAAAEAAAAPVGDPLSSPLVLKARMAALLTHIAEAIE